MRYRNVDLQENSGLSNRYTYGRRGSYQTGKLSIAIQKCESFGGVEFLPSYARRCGSVPWETLWHCLKVLTTDLLASENPLKVHGPDTYRICLARAKRLLEAGTFPKTSLGQIEQDVRSTLPSLHIFHPDSGPMYGELKDILHAWVVSRSDEGLGYVQGAARIAAMILLNMPASPGFIVMKNLLERHCLRSFYGGSSAKDDVSVRFAPHTRT
jgi:hypothetical protein